MTPITERLAEAYQKLDAINEIIFAAENAAMACDVVQPTIKMLSDSDIKRIFDLSLHAEYEASRTHPAEGGEGLTFDAFRAANVARCVKWHPAGIASWSPSDWLTAVTGELGELASLLKMRNRERDGLPGNKFSPTDKHVADELADVLTYLDLLAAVLGVDLGRAAVAKFNEVSERVGFPDRIAAPPPQPVAPEVDARDTGDEEIGGRYPFDGMGNKIDHEAGDRTKNFLREIGVVPSQLLPVAPERGEAKAIAPDNWRLREWAGMFSDQGFVDAADDIVAAADFIDSIGYCEDCGGSGWHTEHGNDGVPCGDSPCDTCNPNGDAEREAQRTPQPPPAPTFRDPTIEDAERCALKPETLHSTSFGWRIEARWNCEGEIKDVAGQHITDKWREVNPIEAYEGVPIGNRFCMPQLKLTHTMGYSAAQALRWWLHAIADASSEGYLLETRLKKYEIVLDVQHKAVDTGHEVLTGECRA